MITDLVLPEIVNKNECKKPNYFLQISLGLVKLSMATKMLGNNFNVFFFNKIRL